MKKKRGTGLATTLMIVAALVTLAFTVMGISFHHLNLTNRASNSQHARNLAEAAISRGIERVLHDNDFGKSPGNCTVNVTFAGAPGGYGVLSFDGTAAGLGIRKSTNNFSNDTATPGDGCTVPPDAVHFHAKGHYNNADKEIDAVLYIPWFDKAVAASGPIIAQENVDIVSLKTGGNFTNEADWLPAHVATNEGSGNGVLFAGDNITVSGDVQSVSGVNAGNATIKGETRSYASSTVLPSLNLASYDTAGKPGVVNITSAPSNNTISGYYHGNNSLTFNGGLTLDGGVLYVNGDLNVNGPVNGTGAIIVSGKTNMWGGGGNLTADSRVAVLSKDDLSIHGVAGDRTAVHGLIYSEHQITGDETNLFGIVLSNDGGGGGSKVDLRNTDLFYQKDASSVNFTVKGTGGSGGSSLLGKYLYTSNSNETGAAWSSVPIESPTRKSGQWIATASGNVSDVWTTGTVKSTYKLPSPSGPNFAGFPVNGTVDLPIKAALKSTLTKTRFYDSVSNTYVLPFRNSANQIVIMQEVAGNLTEVPYSGPVANIKADEFDVSVNGTIYDGADANWATKAAQLFNTTLATQYGLTSPNATETIMINVMNQFQFAPPGATYPNEITFVGSSVGPAASGLLAQNLANGIPIDDSFATTSTGGGGATFLIDLNKGNFIPRADRARLLYWREW